MTEESTYEEDIKINKYALHNELENLSFKIGKWRKKYAESKAIEDKMIADMPILKAEIKTEHEIALAKIESDLRENWEQYSESKLTENAVATKLKTLPEYEEANKKYIEENIDLTRELQAAVEDKEVFYGACKAIETQESSLQNLVKLYLSGYYGDKPKINPELEEQENKKTTLEIKKTLKLKRKTNN